MKRALTAFCVLLVGVVHAGTMPGTGGPARVDPGSAVGNLAIRAVPGSAGVDSISGNTVEVHFFHNNQPLHKVTGTLNEMGLMVVNDVPVGFGVRPLVRIEHDGVTYQEAGPVMDASNPDASIEVTVFETTPVAPAWRVVSRQVIVTPADDRLLVSESVFVENPNDRTWLGSDEASNGKLTTIELTLPERTENITLHAGFHGWCCTTFESGTLGVQMPLMPGRYNYQFTYEVLSEDGTGTLSVGAPAETTELAMIVPESGITAQANGLEAGSVQMTEQGPLRLYTGREVAAGVRPSITLTGLPTAPSPAARVDEPAPAPAPNDGPGSTVLIFLVGVVVVGIAAVLILRRSA